MSVSQRILSTRNGIISYPTYIPVTTFGEKYPLDKLIQPYLPRLAQAAMVSFHYARQLLVPLRIPLFVDSGGFASLFENARIRRMGPLGILSIRREDEVEAIHPRDVLELQEKIADVAFTLDFPIPPNSEKREALRRQRLTIANSLWALENKRRRDLLLFASVQAWDAISARVCAKEYRDCGFDGIAIGGLVPRARNPSLVLSIVEAVRAEVPDLPLHVFGLGKPGMTQQLFEAGVDSVDSSSYVQLAAEGRLWSHPEYQLSDPSASERLHIALCNLATATGRTLPLSASKIVFTTHALFSRRA
jgi:tRNA-guanine family transglycosylase